MHENQILLNKKYMRDYFCITDCELITTHVIKQMKNNDKTKQVNFTIAIYICREYLRNKRNLSPPDVINLIEKHVLPVRPGRKDPRKVKPQASVSFLYRVA